MLATVLRYWETLRWLKPQQIYGRIMFRLGKPRLTGAPAPPLRARPGRWEMPARRRPSLLDAASFRFLNVDAHLARVGWDGPGPDKLWRYNQHYFDDLNAEGGQERRTWHNALIAAWIAANPPAKGTGWEPYPLSMRIVNWIKWLLSGGTATAVVLDSLAAQIRVLEQRLEHHLLGNHLFANAKALVFAGLFFDGPEAARWRRMGFTVLGRETGEQILPDGGQFERSTLYHALAVEDILDLINATAAFATALTADEAALVRRWYALAPTMLQWLDLMSHPDGRIAFFNDAAFAIAPENGSLRDYANRLGLAERAHPPAPAYLAASGYARLWAGDAVLICDMAPVGPDYLPGHAHADTLSFEFSLGASRIVVNGGTSVYGTSAERVRQRGTPAHSTVSLEGKNSSDVWSGFRVGARARPFGASVSAKDGVQTAVCSHDGYRSLAARPVHTREWRLSPGHLSVTDCISAATISGEARFHLHPDVNVRAATDTSGTLHLNDGCTLTWRSPGTAPVRLEVSVWNPEFGVSRPTLCLVVPIERGVAVLELAWDSTVK